MKKNWQKSNVEWKIDNEFLGRSIAYRNILPTDDLYKGIDLTKCADCGKSTKIIVHELMNNSVQQPQVWGYCGVCEVG